MSMPAKRTAMQIRPEQQRGPIKRREGRKGYGLRVIAVQTFLSAALYLFMAADWQSGQEVVKFE